MARVRQATLGPIAFGVGALSLAGCATIGPPPRPQVALPMAYSETAVAAAESDGLDSWWLLFDDVQLTSMIDRALASGFDIRAAQARIDEARAIRSTALNAFAPQGNLGTSVQIRRPYDLNGGGGGIAIPGFEDFAAGLAGTALTRSANAQLPVSWELDLFGRRGATRRAADADLAAARFNAEATRAALVAEVARSLFQARGLAAQRDDALATVTIQRRLRDVLARRAAIGIAARSEVDRIAADVATAEAQANDAAAALEAAKRALLVLLGEGTAPLLGLQVEAQTTLPPTFPQALPSELLTRRPDVREAEARLASATSNRELARLALFPRLTLEPGVGLNYQKGGFDQFNVFWTLGAGLALPVLDRPRLLGELRAQDARTLGAVVAYERAVQTAFGEVDQALIRLAADRRRVDLLEGGARSAARAFDAATIRYQRGFSDLQDLLDAERTLRSARTALTTARTDALLRSVQGFQALGGGWTSGGEG